MDNTILRTEALHAYYVLDVYGKQKILKAVNEVDLAIQEDEIYGIAGESGCGKTTLLKALAAAVEPPLRVMGGRVTYRIAGVDVDVATLTAEEKRKLRLEYIAYVPQGSMSVLNPVARIKETYRDFIESHLGAQQKSEAFELAREHIIDLGLPPQILDAFPHQLSGGMRQRVTIALATLLKPRIIIGDEPTTALDVVVQRGVVQLLKDVQRKLQNTIILVTHDMGVHANIADRIAIMFRGDIVEMGTVEQVLMAPKHPYTQLLRASIPEADTAHRWQGEIKLSDTEQDEYLRQGCRFAGRCPHVMDICRTTPPPDFDVEGAHVSCHLYAESESAA